MQWMLLLDLLVAVICSDVLVQCSAASQCDQIHYHILVASSTCAVFLEQSEVNKLNPKSDWG